MKVLVTGSTGFVGAALCRELTARGDDVYAFHRPSSNLKMLEDLPVQHVIGDLTQPDSVIAAVQGMDVIFHAGALLGGKNNASRMYTVTVEGTRTLLTAALEAGVGKFVHTSSAASLGIPEPCPSNRLSDLHVRMDENHTWNMRPDFWPYGYSKYLAEMEVQKAVSRGLDAVIVNPTVILGAGDLYRQTTSIVVQVARHRIPVLIEGGLNVVHIEDVVKGHLNALEYGGQGKRYLLAGTNLTITALIEEIGKIAGVSTPSVCMPGGAARRLANFLKLFQSFLTLPVSPDQFRLAGNYFYYDNARALEELRLPEPKNVRSAIQDAHDWFIEAGAIPRSRSSSG